MTQGPFNSQRAGKLISAFFQLELNPLIERLHDLAVESSSLRLGFVDCFVESFARGPLRSLENSYSEATIAFFGLYRRWSDLDRLFESAGFSSDAECGAAIGDYLRIQPEMSRHFEVGFRLLAHVDRVLTGQRTAAYNRVAISLSLAAITISVIVAIFK